MNKFNLSIHNFCAKGGIRPEITGVLLEPNRTTATDSFVLIQVSTPTDKPQDNFQPFILPADKAKEAMQAVDLIKMDTLKEYAIKGEYPKVNEIMQEQGKYMEVIVQPQYLEKIGKFYKEFVKDNKFGECNVKIKIPYEQNAPIHFEAENKEKQVAKTVLMPIKS